MNTIGEDYVSYETAQLLKNKGFDELCYACYEYFRSNVTMYSGLPFEYKGEPIHNTNDRVKCPTLQMAMKWLREVYNIHIYTFYANSWIFAILDLETGEEFTRQKGYSSEEAAEAALKYCLTNLIK